CRWFCLLLFFIIISIYRYFLFFGDFFDCSHAVSDLFRCIVLTERKTDRSLRKCSETFVSLGGAVKTDSRHDTIFLLQLKGGKCIVLPLKVQRDNCCPLFTSLFSHNTHTRNLFYPLKKHPRKLRLLFSNDFDPR